VDLREHLVVQEQMGHRVVQDLLVVQEHLEHQDPLDLRVKVTNMQLHQQHLIL
jgi:hypothetical protein